MTLISYSIYISFYFFFLIRLGRGGRGGGRGGSRGGASGGGGGACFAFQKGECTRGDSCRFTH